MDKNDADVNSFFKKNQLLYMLLFYTLGVIAARTGKPVVLICILSLASSVSFVFFYKVKKLLFNGLLLLTLLLAGYFNVLYRFQGDLPENHIARYVSEKKMNFIGKILGNPEQQKNGERLYVSVETVLLNDKAVQAQGIIRITTYFLHTGLHIGERVKFEKVRLRSPENFDNPGGFDYQQYLMDRGIYVTCSLSKKEQFQILLSSVKKTPYSFLLGLSNRLSAIIDNSVPSPTDNLLRTMVIGESGILGTDIRALFSKTGIAHILSVSGLHVGFIGLLFFWMFKRFFQVLFFRVNIRYLMLGHASKFASFFTIFFVIAYAVMTGGSPPASRSAIMTSVFLCAIIIGKEREIFSSIVLAASILLAFNPLQVFDIGFQLSFIATIFFVYGIMVWDERIGGDEYIKISQPNRAWFYSIFKWLIKSLFLSLFAVFGTLPLTAYYFNIVSVISPVANLLAIPVTGVIVPSVIVAGFLSGFASDFSKYFFWIPEVLGRFLIYFSEILIKLPYCYLRIGSISLYFIFSYYFFMVGIFICRKKISLKIGLFLSCFLLVFVLVSPIFLTQSEKKKLVKIVFLDVGQGNAAFITFPSGQNMLIDGGGASGDFNIGEWVVAPFLWRSNIRKIDYILGTHADRDHIGGLTYILKEFEVGKYLDNGYVSDELFDMEIKRIIADRSISYHPVNSGEKIMFTGGEIEFFNTGASGKNDNERTVVSRLTFGDFSVMFTGDIVKNVEEKLITEGTNITSVIMDSPHHGSKYSSSIPFLKKISPNAIIISSGKKNAFGHPHSETIQRYKEIGAKIFRTDQKGAITVTSDGTGYSIKTFLN